MRKRYYIAYGSNLSTEQMRYRTPDAKIVGRAILYGWQLVFKVHATIEENPKKNTPVLVWEISEADEKPGLLLQKGTSGGGVPHGWRRAGTAYRHGLHHGGWT